MPDRPDMVSAARHRFPGGQRLVADTAALDGPIERMPAPEHVVLPLAQHEGAPAQPVVAPGDSVLRGQLVARASGPVSANVHASISGTVREIAPHPVPSASGLPADCIVIDGDGEDRAVAVEAPDGEYALIDPNLLRHDVAEAGVVGQGGAGFPSAIKLAAAVESGLTTLVINGAECDPYICCDEATLREHADEVLSGAQVMLHILQINRCVVAVEVDKRESCEAVAGALRRVDDDRFTLVEVPAVYPEGGERQLVQVLSGKEVPSDGLPLDIGYICHNVGTARAVAAAVLRGESMVSRIVTVCGPGIERPRNVEVRIGTPVRDVVAFCGGYRGEVARLVVGGAMMGVALADDATPLIKSSNCIVAFDEATARPAGRHLPCIRCGDCADACPASLLPQQLYWHASTHEPERATRFHLFDCIECGCCDLACPSHIPLTAWFRHAKAELRLREMERGRATHARRRFDARTVRLEQEDERRRERMAQRKRAVSADTDTEDPAAVIQAAVARARARRERREAEEREK